MPKLVPMTGTVVIRDGRRVRPVIGKAFNFTKEEIADLEAAGAKLRKPTDEAEESEAEAASSTTPSSAEKSQAKARGGKKPATAAKSDEEAETEDEDL
jgi:hypothetical protein